MKTKSIITLFICAVLLTGCACNNNSAAKTAKSEVVSAMAQFKGTDNVEVLEFSGPVLGLGKLMLQQATEGIDTKSIKKVCILTGSDADESTRESIMNSISNSLNGYELLLSAKDAEDKVDIYTKMDGDFIKELILFVKNEATVIALTGNMSLDDIEDISNIGR